MSFNNLYDIYPKLLSLNTDSVNGHWWVLANSPNNTVLDFDTALPKDSFVIDIWGAIRGDLPSSVAYNPSKILYDCGEDNTLQVVCTVPAKP